MGSFTIVLGLLVAVAAVQAQRYPHFSTWDFEEVDSEEHGQASGPKSTNCTCGRTNKASGRIVGGRYAKVNEYPHMVGIVEETSYGSMSLFCGATILTPHHVITAAHCTEDLSPRSKLKVLVGAHELDDMKRSRFARLYTVIDHIEHGAYNTKTIKYDIAMLVIKEKIQFNSAVGPACLPTEPMNQKLVGQWVKVTGWGDTTFEGEQSKTLQKVNLKVVPLDQCAAVYKTINSAFPTQFCTYRPRKDSCQGDSGGPVTWLDPETNRYTLVGLVSYGKGCASTSPGVNTDVFAFMSWIQTTIASTTRDTDSSYVSTCSKRG